jgi:thymidylate synthase
MPFVNSYDFQSAFIKLLGELMSNGQEVEVRGKRTKELLNCHISIANPVPLCYFIPFRKDNVFARIAETLWVLKGEDDIEWLSYYLPRAADYSDDGKTWHAAYGKRLRRWDYEDNDVQHSIDQIRLLVNKLNKDPLTRQGVMTIWKPEDDNLESLDIPCNNWLHFILRDFGITRFALLSVAQRSADVFWGWSNINAFEWSTLLKMIAFWTNTEIGKIDWYVTSMHMYNTFTIRAQMILDAYHYMQKLFPDNFTWHSPRFTTPFLELDSAIYMVMRDELLARTSDRNDVQKLDSTGDELLDTFMRMLVLYIKFFQGSDTEFLANYILEMPESEYKYAALLHIARNRPEILDYVPTSNGGCMLVNAVINLECT